MRVARSVISTSAAARRDVRLLRTASDAAQRSRVYQDLLDAIATHRVADRPDRYEPRVKKRRPKPYDLMNRPRAVLRQALYDEEDAA